MLLPERWVRRQQRLQWLQRPAELRVSALWPRLLLWGSWRWLQCVPILRLRPERRPVLQFQSGPAGCADGVSVLHTAWSARFLAEQPAEHRALLSLEQGARSKKLASGRQPIAESRQPKNA